MKLTDVGLLEQNEALKARLREVECDPDGKCENIAKLEAAEKDAAYWKEEARRYSSNADFHQEQRAVAEARLREVEEKATILTGGITDQHDRAERAEAEVRKLREASERLAGELCTQAGPDPHDWPDSVKEAPAEYRAALAAAPAEEVES